MIHIDLCFKKQKGKLVLTELLYRRVEVLELWSQEKNIHSFGESCNKPFQERTVG